MSDVAKCLRRLQAGDRRAFDRLFRLESRRLYSIALRILHDPALAEDATQETFLRVLEGRAPLREERAAKRWLGRVVARVAVDIARREGARRRREVRHAMEPKEGDRPEKGVVEEERLRLLSEALKTLSVETRAALWLHIAEGEGVREVARALDSSRSTVSRRVQTGLSRLRREFRDHGYAIPGVLGLRQIWRTLPEAEPPPSFLARLGELGRELSDRTGPASSAPPARRGAAPGALAVAGSVMRRKAVVMSGAVVLVAAVGIVWLAGRPGDPPDGAGAPAVVALPPETSAPAAGDSPEPAATREAARVEEPLPEGLVIEGRVLGPLGSPVPGADVSAFADPAAVRDVHALLDAWGFIDILDALLSPPEPLARGVTDTEGRFHLVLEERGDLEGLVLVARRMEKDGNEAGEDEDWRDGEVLSGGLRLDSEAAGEVTISTEPAARVSGHVVSAGGSPLAGALVALIPDPALPHDRDFTSYDLRGLLERIAPATALSGADGSFEVVAVPMGTQGRRRYRLIAARDGHARGHRSWDAQTGGAVRLVLEPGVALPGRAVLPDEAEGALEGARIAALGGSAEAGWFATAEADEAGDFSLTVAEGAGFEVFAKMPGRVTPVRRSWREGADPPPLLVDFSRGGSIEGRVYLPGDVSVDAGVRVLCRDLEGAFTSSSTRTDAYGRYRLDGLPFELTFDLFVELPGYYSLDFLTSSPTPDRRTVTHDVRLARTATIRGHVLDPEGRPLEGAAVEVVAAAESDREGVHLRWREEVLELGRTETDAGGRFTATDIVPRGKVYVWAYHPRWGECFSDEVEFSFDEKPIADVTIRMESAGLEVDVLGPGGKRHDGVRVELVSMTLWDKLPSGMNLGQWFAQRTSMDISRYKLEYTIIPGNRSAGTTSGAPCVWRDLQADRYMVSVHKSFTPPGLANWETEYWLYGGTLESRLTPLQVHRLPLVIDDGRTVRGRVTDPRGQPNEPLRVQVYFTPDPIPGLTDLFGYSVTHTREDGSFEAFGVGPGPYRVTFGDREDRIVAVEGVPEGEQDLRVVYDLHEKDG